MFFIEHIELPSKYILIECHLTSSVFNFLNYFKILSNDSRYIKHPFALALHDEWLYVTDWSLKSVLKINKFNGGEISIITSSFDKQPMSIVVVSNDTDNCWLDPCLNVQCNN